MDIETLLFDFQLDFITNLDQPHSKSLTHYFFRIKLTKDTSKKDKECSSSDSCEDDEKPKKVKKIKKGLEDNKGKTETKKKKEGLLDVDVDENEMQDDDEDDEDERKNVDAEIKVTNAALSINEKMKKSLLMSSDDEVSDESDDGMSKFLVALSRSCNCVT